ncbi:hypothetical protein EK21DRAFT_108284 [Setomelanomma holmii]|uniref:Uncharacterized protein n=1 Tax=Setomelanomma holmii TaxID=210430 RepID=A0A9P4LRD9_9PLEO|nr:hypothetical protein EK21DRAFT_108284 [Setomelanomma holmii]
MAKVEESGREVYRVSSKPDQIFPVASITKLLVAAAVITTIENIAPNEREGDPYFRFKGIQDQTLSLLHNLQKTSARDKMRALPESPTLYHLLVHDRGLPSFNHLLLAPDGTLIMNSSDLLDEVLPPFFRKGESMKAMEHTPKYSNINYCAVALAVEAL